VNIRRAVLLATGAFLVVFVGYSYWYMIEPEAPWEGEPLESSMPEELVAIESTLRDDVAYLSETIGPRNPSHYDALVLSADWIRSRWSAYGYEVLEQHFDVEGMDCENLEVEIRGRRAPSEIILLGAQYDSWPESPGANNNAGGVAVLMQVSEMLRGYEPDRTIRLVAFTTQEPPYSKTEWQGSVHYARRSHDREEDIRVMMSMDAIGVYKQDAGTQTLPFPFSLLYPDRGNFLAFIADLGTRARLVEATRGFNRASSFPLEAGAVPRWVKGASWSDHASFWDFGYPGIQITDTGAFRSAAHTTSDDTMEKMDFAALARVAVGMYGAVVELATIQGS
jgi:hypothetical protein